MSRNDWNAWLTASFCLVMLGAIVSGVAAIWEADIALKVGLSTILLGAVLFIGMLILAAVSANHLSNKGNKE